MLAVNFCGDNSMFSSVSMSLFGPTRLDALEARE